jgi:hypothetical protein
VQENKIKTQIEIAVSLLGSSRTDGYGNGKITHSQRNFITNEVIDLLAKIDLNFDQKVNSIIPKNSTSTNPPDEL